MIPKLKVDPDLYYHYLIGVGMKSLRSGKDAGQLFLKYGPIYFTNDDIKNLHSTVLLTKDKLFPTSQTTAAKVFNSEELIHSVSAMKLSVLANNCTMHHFSSKEKLDEEYFDLLVKTANKSEYNKKLLERSKI